VLANTRLFARVGLLVYSQSPEALIQLPANLCGICCGENGTRRGFFPNIFILIQSSIEMDAEIKESTRKTEEKLDGRYKEGHERKKPKRRPVGR